VSRPEPVVFKLVQICTGLGVALAPPNRLLPVVVLAWIYLHADTVIADFVPFAAEPRFHLLPAVDVVNGEGVACCLPEFAAVKPVPPVGVLGVCCVTRGTVIG